MAVLKKIIGCTIVSGYSMFSLLKTLDRFSIYYIDLWKISIFFKFKEGKRFNRGNRSVQFEDWNLNLIQKLRKIALFVQEQLGDFNFYKLLSTQLWHLSTVLKLSSFSPLFGSIPRFHSIHPKLNNEFLKNHNNLVKGYQISQHIFQSCYCWILRIFNI